jgi:methylated-DNA-[protein]-cysteine S-methyltransferase
MNYYSFLKSPLEDLLLVANPTALTGVYFVGSAHVPPSRPDWVLDPRHSVLEQAAGQLSDYFNGAKTSFSVPLHFAGTDFQMRVWRQIAMIPFGQTITYSDLAGRVGAPYSTRAIRAAGTATGRNPLGIIIPCHRVVGKNGSLGGYAGGLDRKRYLLALEQSNSLSIESIESPATAVRGSGDYVENPPLPRFASRAPARPAGRLRPV